MLRAFPFYQPIISVENGKIYGYEALGRFETDGEIKSLGAYFGDPGISPVDKLNTDRSIRKQAFDYLKNYKNTNADSPKLFINVNPSWIIESGKAGKEYPSISLMREAGIHGSNIVIEITEEDAATDADLLNRFVEPYRQEGCKIAVDDFYFDNFGRLLTIQPDLVKIDRKLVLKSQGDNKYHKLMHYISRFSDELGIAVLFEGVENEEQVHLAIDQGARYLQGFAFSQAAQDFVDPLKYQSGLNNEIKTVVTRNYRKSRNAINLERDLNRIVGRIIENENKISGGRNIIDDMIRRIAGTLPKECFRLFVCRSDGEQISSNHFLKSGSFIEQPEFFGCNWGWRPYFIFNIVMMERSGKGILSMDYIDIETRQKIRTFSYPITDELFIFIDINDVF